MSPPEEKSLGTRLLPLISPRLSEQSLPISANQENAAMSRCWPGGRAWDHLDPVCICPPSFPLPSSHLSGSSPRFGQACGSRWRALRSFSAVMVYSWRATRAGSCLGLMAHCGARERDLTASLSSGRSKIFHRKLCLICTFNNASVGVFVMLKSWLLAVAVGH